MHELFKETKYLQFFIVERKPKTLVIAVINKKKEILGDIRYYPPWKQYVFNTDGLTQLTFNNRCLQDITNVLTHLNTCLG